MRAGLQCAVMGVSHERIVRQLDFQGEMSMPRWFALNFRSGLAIGGAIAIAVAAAAITYERYDTETLKRTKNRGAVLCGVNTGLPGFSIADDKGNWTGFDVDFCRAIAAAIFDDPKKVKFVPLDAERTVHGAAEAQDRRAVAQLDLEHVARNRLRAAFRGGVLLRRPGLHGAQVAQHRLRPRARRQQGLRPGRARRPSSTSPTISAPTI